jgi:threonine dehydrogenase-like Zn-dependent dehydrogenase
VCRGPGQQAWDEVPDPEITGEADAIAGVGATAICGTGLHILAGDVPEAGSGTIVGHEAAGTRPDAARKSGAGITVHDSREDPAAVITDLTGRPGADAASEAAGAPSPSSRRPRRPGRAGGSRTPARRPRRTRKNNRSRTPPPSAAALTAVLTREKEEDR